MAEAEDKVVFSKLKCVVIWSCDFVLIDQRHFCVLWLNLTNTSKNLLSQHLKLDRLDELGKVHGLSRGYDERYGMCCALDSNHMIEIR